MIVVAVAIQTLAELFPSDLNPKLWKESLMSLIRVSRQNSSFSFALLTRRLHGASSGETVSASYSSSSRLRDHYNFQPPPPLSSENPNPSQKKKNPNPQYRPPSSLEGVKKVHSDLPFDFRFSYTESSSNVRPIGLREPKYSPFGPDRLDREWTGVCAPAVDPKVESVDGAEDPKLEEERRKVRENIQGASLTEAERKLLVKLCQRNKTKRQINLGRDGLTHNMLNDIYNHWKHAEAVQVKCLGVPTLDMKNVIFHLEDKTFGQVVSKHCGTLVLYRGRNYDPKKRPKIPLMLWKPHEPVYPRLIQTTIDGISMEETKAMRKKGLAVPALAKLAKNGYYCSLVPMVRDAFLVSELVRIDCLGFGEKGLQENWSKAEGEICKELCFVSTHDREDTIAQKKKMT